MSNSIALLALEAADGTVVLTSITLVFAMLVALASLSLWKARFLTPSRIKRMAPKPPPRHLPPLQRPLHRPQHRQGCSCRPRSTRC